MIASSEEVGPNAKKLKLSGPMSTVSVDESALLIASSSSTSTTAAMVPQQQENSIEDFCEFLNLLVAIIFCKIFRSHARQVPKVSK
jgi:hypothetical protein